MSLTKTQIELVKDTFAQVAQIAETAAGLFYGRLFELDPSLRLLLKDDMKEQRRKLMQMLSLTIHALDNLHGIASVVHVLTQDQVGYGVTLVHYPTVAEALLWMLEKGLGEAFTAEIKEAWTAIYVMLRQVGRANLQARFA